MSLILPKSQVIGLPMNPEIKDKLTAQSDKPAQRVLRPVGRQRQ